MSLKRKLDYAAPPGLKSHRTWPQAFQPVLDLSFFVLLVLIVVIVLAGLKLW
jgi:hypothetical protein